jgi:Sugar kinases, ribokinase family
VTTGEGGVFFIEEGKVAHEPAFAVDVVDTLGAGDVWHGALALALAEGMVPRPAVRFANATAAIKCTRFGGGRGAPSRAEVERLLQS